MKEHQKFMSVTVSVLMSFKAPTRACLNVLGSCEIANAKLLNSCKPLKLLYCMLKFLKGREDSFACEIVRVRVMQLSLIVKW